MNNQMGSMILLNESGDVKIIWSEEHELEMRALIEKKLKEGYSFFIIEKKLLGLIQRTREVKSINEIQKGTELLLKDADAVKLFSEGKVSVEKRKSKEVIRADKRSKDVDEILKNDSVAVRPIAAG